MNELRKHLGDARWVRFLREKVESNRQALQACERPKGRTAEAYRGAIARDEAALEAWYAEKEKESSLCEGCGKPTPQAKLIGFYDPRVEDEEPMDVAMDYGPCCAGRKEGEGWRPLIDHLKSLFPSEV